jgi:hypothetical protein
MKPLFDAVVAANRAMAGLRQSLGPKCLADTGHADKSEPKRRAGCVDHEMF